MREKEMRKSSLFSIVAGVCMILAFVSFELISIAEPTLTFEECLYIWMNVGYETVSPTFMFLSILTIILAVLATIYCARICLRIFGVEESRESLTCAPEV